MLFFLCLFEWSYYMKCKGLIKLKLIVIIGVVLYFTLINNMVNVYADDTSLSVNDYLFDDETPFDSEDINDAIKRFGNGGLSDGLNWNDVINNSNEETISNNTLSDNSLSDKKELRAKYVEPDLYIPDASDEWKLILVNKQIPVPEDYDAELITINGGMQVRKEVAPPLARMLSAAKEDGVSLIICSAYRSYNRQTELFNRKLNKLLANGYTYLDAYRIGSFSVTLPGTSEHQLGMALDIITSGYSTLDSGFEKTEAGIWLNKHCSEYGFILRYPKEKEYVTGITYEPWHFRYVGVEAAKCMTENNLTLEEYLKKIGNK